jgi:hypothetical protein
LFVEKRNPVCAAVRRLPHSACDRAEVVRIRFADDTFDRKRTAAAKWTDLPPTHSIEQLFIDRSRRRWSGGWSGSKRSWEKENRSSENDFNQVKRTVTRRGHPPKVKSLRFGSTGIARNARRSERGADQSVRSSRGVRSKLSGNRSRLVWSPAFRRFLFLDRVNTELQTLQKFALNGLFTR